MRTVNEVSKLTGVSIRALQYYDKIGLLKPTKYTESGYRLYDDTALERLQQILLFRELEFPLKEIGEIISRPDFDKNQALEQQITLLTLKKERLERLIDFARGIKFTGVRTMDFLAFDTTKIDEYTQQAKAQWGKTAEYKEFEQKSQERSKEEERAVMEQFMQIFVEFGKIKDRAAEATEAQSLVKRLQEYIMHNFYTCSNEILAGLGQMYDAGGEFTANIDRVGGNGTAAFAAEAVRVYCNT
ncbi:MAG: MerR family transcriptional regulator [Lachnospiraceae bacterium]|nr:MerR family transcriptional regulator [Lachnospiraceae bacterium]